MRQFWTQGPVNAKEHYVVSRSEELADYIDRVKQGRYIVLFAPRQTGKTTFFQNAIDALEEEADTYFPIQLDFEEYVDISLVRFYPHLCKRLCQQIVDIFQRREQPVSVALNDFLEHAEVTDHLSMGDFFEDLRILLQDQRLVLIIDEFDGIPQPATSGFLHTLRRIYLSRTNPRCPYSVSIIGVKSITQLDYALSISPFNIQDEFTLPNFTAEQVHELIVQYTDEVGQPFAPEVIEILHKQTAGQPFLVNRLAQILTTELGIPKSETIQMHHFLQAYTHLIEERNTNVEHLITNIRRDPRFEKMLMRIAFYGSRINFSLHNETVSQLATYGILTKGQDGLCKILNPVYLHCIIQALKPLINGLEDEYFPEDGPMDFTDYITLAGDLQMAILIANFGNFIERAGFKILQVPETPQEFVGQYLLFAYLDEFVKIVGAAMYLEVPTGRGRADLVISHKGQTYIVETKVWRSERRYQTGKYQLAAYLKSEGAKEGYYIVFDYRQNPHSQIETETIEGYTIHSYVIPVLQARPSQSAEVLQPRD